MENNKFRNTNHELFFKIAFIALASLKVIKFFAAGLLLNMDPYTMFLGNLGINLSPMQAIPSIIYFLIVVVYVAYIALLVKYVYFYSKAKGYSAWTWLFIVVFVPYYIGLIIYVMFVFRIEFITFIKNIINEVRATKATKVLCKQCGESINKESKVCPYCSTENE